MPAEDVIACAPSVPTLTSYAPLRARRTDATRASGTLPQPALDRAHLRSKTRFTSERFRRIRGTELAMKFLTNHA